MGPCRSDGSRAQSSGDNYRLADDLRQFFFPLSLGGDSFPRERWNFISSLLGSILSWRHDALLCVCARLIATGAHSRQVGEMDDWAIIGRRLKCDAGWHYYLVICTTGSVTTCNNPIRRRPRPLLQGDFRCSRFFFLFSPWWLNSTNPIARRHLSC